MERHWNHGFVFVSLATKVFTLERGGRQSFTSTHSVGFDWVSQHSCVVDSFLSCGFPPFCPSSFHDTSLFNCMPLIELETQPVSPSCRSSWGFLSSLCALSLHVHCSLICNQTLLCKRSRRMEVCRVIVTGEAQHQTSLDGAGTSTPVTGDSSHQKTSEGTEMSHPGLVNNVEMNWI